MGNTIETTKYFGVGAKRWLTEKEVGDDVDDLI